MSKIKSRYLETRIKDLKISAADQLMAMNVSSNMLPPIEFKQSNSNINIRDIELGSRQKSSDRCIMDRLDSHLEYMLRVVQSGRR